MDAKFSFKMALDEVLMITLNGLNILSLHWKGRKNIDHNRAKSHEKHT